MTESKVYVCQLSQKEKDYAAASLNETDDNRSQKIEEIREWILKNDNLHACTDDFFILRFLRACKFNIETTKYKFWNYHEQRGNTPEWYANKDPFLVELQDMFELGVFLPMRKLDNKGRMVVLIRIAAHDPNKHKQADMLKASLMTLDIAIRENESVSLHGIIAILDLAGISFGHALQFSPSVIKKLVHAWQGCYPLRIQALEFINSPIYVNVVLNVFKSFMVDKLKRRVHVHTYGKKTFLDIVQRDILPVEYGGTDGSINDLKDYWKCKVEENRAWFAVEECYKVKIK
ncbi:retinol-binding protein pinta-like [Vespa crabro]|uniref:retinol-binding protein pinta-like n=1 Tax=Vespa crabro TaxID=7445 RepID=UPI001F02CC5B|nr:retinol-binding protein pinta-like [Vespa crabro]